MKFIEGNLSEFATNPPCEREGFLKKLGEYSKNFQQRYFVLKGNLLFYFGFPNDKKPLGLIIVEGCTIELSLEYPKQHCFEIVFNGQSRCVLCASTHFSMECWMKAVTCAGYEYKQLLIADLQRQLKILKTANKHTDGNTVDTIGDATTILNTEIPTKPPRKARSISQLPVVAPKTVCAPLASSIFYQVRENPFDRPITPIEIPKQIVPTPVYVPKLRFSRSEFYLELPDIHHYSKMQTQQDTASICSTASISPELQELRNMFNLDFEYLHEHFGQPILKDIAENRATISQHSISQNNANIQK